VLAARFHDAKFFYAEDRKKSLATHGEKLAEMLWIRGVKDEAGRQFTMHMRAGDVAASAGELARTFEASGSLSADPDWLLTQGWLCKADLTTQMVGEFDTLQGHVGRLLANEDAKDEGLSGDALVARLAKNLAIEEHYLPRFAGDALPRSPEGVCLALAERITLLCRTYAAGMAPKGGDPLALRRAANGVLAIVRERRLAVSPGMLIEAAQMGTVITGEARVSLEEFILARLRATLGEEGVPTDVIEAVFATGETDVLALADRAGAFSALVAAGGFGAIRATFRRVAGLVKQNPGERAELSGLDPAALGPAGVALAAAVDAVNTRASVADQLNVLVALRPLVDAFFDSVMVMAEELPLRTARLGLLRTIVARFSNLADFSKLSTE
jgi:glycyl-tRNA synthetase beta chain